MRRPSALAAAALLLAISAGAGAQTAKLSCVSRDEAGALVTFALPTVVTRLAERCRPALPATAYLSANAARLADRYAADADAAWPQARRAIGRLFSTLLGQPMPAEMNGDLVRQLAEPTLATLLAEKVRTADCAVASDALQALATVSARDIGRLAAIGAAFADRKGEGIAGVLKICRPEDVR